MPGRSGSPVRRALALLVVALLATACPSADEDPAGAPTPSTTTPSPDPAEGEIVVAVPHEPVTLDPFAPAGETPVTRDLTRLLMPAFYRLGPAGSRERWLLAEEPVVEEGPPFALRVRLRDDAVWSDGTPVTMEDVAFTWRRASALPGYASIIDVAASSPKTGRIVFSERYDAWPDLFSAGLGVLPAHAADELGSGWSVSGGPFVFRRWQPGLDVILDANPRAWGDGPAVATLRFVFVPDEIGALELLARGDVDALGTYQAPDWLRRARAIDGARVSTETGASWAVFVMNTETGPFADGSVRRALAHAIDRERIVRGLVGADGARLNGIPPDGTDGPFGRYGDPGRARELLGGKRPRATVAFAGDALPALVIRAMQFQAKEVGFDLQALPIGVEELWGEWLDGDEMEAAVIVLREPPHGADRPRFGVAGDPSGAVPVFPLYAVGVTIVAGPRVAGPCASAAADGPFWNAHRWRLDGTAAACPTALAA